MNRDFRELLRGFNVHQVEYLVVGAHAMAAHGFIRATKDLAIRVRARIENSHRAYQALAEFGASVGDLRPEDFSRLGLIYQIGVPPVRIDVITQIDGITFDEAWPDRYATQFEGEPAYVLSMPHLIRNKRASGRPRDLADVEVLEQNHRVDDDSDREG